jgi:hypothetical protein
MIKQIDDDLYQTVCTWWVARGWPELPQGFLPKRGYVAFVGEKPIIAGFLYKDETSYFGMMEWIVAAPDASKEEKTIGFNELCEHISQVAKNAGVKLLMTAVNNPSLQQRYENNGFNPTDTGMTHLQKVFV